MFSPMMQGGMGGGAYRQSMPVMPNASPAAFQNFAQSQGGHFQPPVMPQMPMQQQPQQGGNDGMANLMRVAMMPSAAGGQNPVSQGGPITSNPAQNMQQLAAGGNVPGINWNQAPSQMAMGPFMPQTAAGQAAAAVAPQAYQNAALQTGGAGGMAPWLRNMFGFGGAGG